MEYLSVKGLLKVFGKTTVLEKIDRAIAEGELATLLGPSGCGKSILLRCIAGLTLPDSSSVHLAGSDITSVAPQRCNIGMVFQNYALFPNMTVVGNISFGLKMQRVSANEIAQRVEAIIALVELRGHENKFVHQLSGGQRQRVALARALVVRTPVLLLDDPLSALDARIRKMLQEIRRIQQQLGLTTIFVTHDQEEALLLSDRIVVMDGGQIIQEGTAEMIYTRPVSAFVARFIGNHNLLDPEERAVLGMQIDGLLAIRPESIAMDKAGSGGCAAVVQQHRLLGNVIRYSVMAHGCPLIIDTLNRNVIQQFAVGAPVDLRFDHKQFQHVD